jgi:hypothetical protein
MADVFRVPMEVTYALQGGEPALMAMPQDQLI